jgi:N-acetylneuraminic acid mutarotase
VADILYAIGGEAADGEGAVESYALLPQENRWQVFNVAEIPFTADAGVTSLGGNIYVIGGRSGEQLSGDMYTYQVLYTVSFPVLVK